jgi:Fe-S cluster assembly protein SufB
MSAESEKLESLVNRRYEHGFVTDIATETLPPGLDEDVVRAISARKNEPEFMLEWRLRAYRQWLEMQEPTWAHVHYPPIDFEAISYFAAPKSDDDRPKSLDEVDPKLLETYDKLGIPLHERARLAGVWTRSLTVCRWRQHSRRNSPRPALFSALSPKPSLITRSS